MRYIYQNAKLIPYAAFVYGEGEHAANAAEAIEASYAADKTDEFVLPCVTCEGGNFLSVFCLLHTLTSLLITADNGALQFTATAVLIKEFPIYRIFIRVKADILN